MGYLTFLIGRFFYNRDGLKRFRNTLLKEQCPLLKKYGLFLIIVAALTPLPWAAISLLVGSAGYPSKRYLKYALFRFLRFAIYGYIIFQTHII
jgi:membrane protein YqaA with SNARE-associated domain